MKILNLDEISSDDREVVIGGVKYTIPGDMPVETMLRIMENSHRLQENNMDLSAFRDGLDIMISLFKIRNPKVDVEKIKNDLTMKRYTQLTTFIFGGFEEAEKKPVDTSEGGESSV